LQWHLPRGNLALMQTFLLAENFASVLGSAGLSKSDAADYLEISAVELESLLSGSAKPSPQQLRALSTMAQLHVKNQTFQTSLFPFLPPRNPSTKKDLAQFFTSPKIADFMADMFESPNNKVTLLDAGAGEGALTSAFVNRWSKCITITGEAHEVDDETHSILARNLHQLQTGQSIVAVKGDFLEFATKQITQGLERRFTHAILNPPYKKISTTSNHRSMLSAVGLETVNLYTAFVAMAVALSKDGAEIVAIIPRSFCNGPYYAGFRRFVFERCALSTIHVFERRDMAFASDGVLQENVIIKLVVGGMQGDVQISISSDQTFSDHKVFAAKFQEVVRPDDKDLFIRVPTSSIQDGCLISKFVCTLPELGLTCSTGPVVDFRSREFLQSNYTVGSVPLLYPCHFENSKTVWPSFQNKKPNAILVNAQTQKMLVPKGYYVVVRRFSSKEKRRIYASVLAPDEMPGEFFGIENHLNFFHLNKKPLDVEFCWGLAAYLMSSEVDAEFRNFSGHTQVNATDLRKIHYPNKDQIIRLGKEMLRLGSINTATVDEFLDGL
jgi:adenine-specific DNA-methyltransferase